MKHNYYEEYEVAFKALKEIAAFGKVKSGHGYSCHRMAQEAIDKIIKIGDDRNYYS